MLIKKKCKYILYYLLNNIKINEDEERDEVLILFARYNLVTFYRLLAAYQQKLVVVGLGESFPPTISCKN